MIRPFLESWDSHLSNGGGLVSGDVSYGILWADRNGDHFIRQSVERMIFGVVGVCMCCGKRVAGEVVNVCGKRIQTNRYLCANRPRYTGICVQTPVAGRRDAL